MHSAVISTAALALGAMAQSSMSTTTASASQSVDTSSAYFFRAGGPAMVNVPGFDPDHAFSVEVVDANKCETTYHVVATVPQIGVQTYTIFQGSTDYAFKYDFKTNGASVTATETCTWSGTTQAVCTDSISYSVSGATQTSASASTTITSWSSTAYPITSGGDKLASATGACTSHSSAAAPTGLFADVYKVVVVPAAAVVAAALV